MPVTKSRPAPAPVAPSPHELAEIVRKRKLATLSMFWRGVFADAQDVLWICCVACGALYPDPSDLEDCHRCQVAQETR